MTEMYFLPVPEPGVHGQGAGRADFFPGLSPRLVDSSLFPVSSQGLHLHITVQISSPKDATYIGLGPTTTTSF